MKRTMKKCGASAMMAVLAFATVLTGCKETDPVPET